MRKPSRQAIEDMLKRVPLTDLNSEVDMRHFAGTVVPEAMETTARIKKLLHEEEGKLTPKVSRALYKHSRDQKGGWCMVPVNIAMWLDLRSRSRDERRVIALRLINAIRNARLVPSIGDRAINEERLSAFPPAVTKSVLHNSAILNVESISGIECLLNLLCFTLEGREIYPEDVLDPLFVDVFPAFEELLMVPVRSALKTTKSTTPLVETAPYRFMCKPQEFYGTMLLCATKAEKAAEGLMKLASASAQSSHGRFSIADYPTVMEKMLSVVLCTTAPTFKKAMERSRLYARHALW